jgi:hypothetical protein
MTCILYAVGLTFFGHIVTGHKRQLVALGKEYFYELSFLFLLIIAFAAYSSTSEFASWDDFSHWGSMSKELIQNGAFEYNLSPTALLKTHMHYPRGPAIYHYFMLLIPGYSEGGALFTHFLLHLIFIVPLMANKNWYQTLFIIAVIFAAVVNYTTGLRSIYNDSTTGLLFASVFLIYLSEANKLKALYLILPILVFLPLFREIGLVLSLIAASILIYLSYKHEDFGQVLPVYVAMLVVPYLLQSMWFWYFTETHDGLGRNKHSMDNLLLLFNGENWLVAANYVKFMLKFLIREGSIVAYVLLILSWFGIKKHNKNLSKEWYTVFGALFVGFIIFALWRLYLYYAIFSKVEAVQARSITRYCGTYCLVFVVMACYYIKHSTFTARFISRTEAIIFTIVALIASISVFKNIIRVNNKMDPELAAYNQYIQYVHRLISEGNIVQFVYDNKHNGIDCYKLNYRLSPHLSSKEFYRCLDAGLSFVENAASKEFKKSEGDQDDRTVIYYPFLNKIEFLRQ